MRIAIGYHRTSIYIYVCVLPPQSPTALTNNKKYNYPSTAAARTGIMNCLLGFVAILALLSSSSLAKLDGPSCTEVTTQVVPCLAFIKSSAGNPSPACCSGVKNISSQTKSAGDRKDVCECLKQALGGIGPYDKNRLPLLPKKCGVSINLPPIDSNTNCAKVLAFYGV